MYAPLATQRRIRYCSRNFRFVRTLGFKIDMKLNPLKCKMVFQTGAKLNNFLRFLDATFVVAKCRVARRSNGRASYSALVDAYVVV